MARRVAELPKGVRVTDYISLGVIAKTFPVGKVKEVLERGGKSSRRQRDLPAHVMVYYVIAMALYMRASCREVLRCLLEGLQWLKGPEERVHVAGRSAISQARTRLGYDAVKELHDEVVRPVAVKGTKGAWYRRWHVVSMDGSTMDVPNTEGNRESFGRPGASRGKSAYPQVRFVSLVESGTHVLFGTALGGQAGHPASAQGHVVHCRSQLLQFQAVAASPWHWSRAFVESEEQPFVALREAIAGRFISQPDIPFVEGPAQGHQRGGGAGHRVQVTRRLRL